MQWSPDRNGGFSRVDPARLFLPAIQDPIYGFDAVNVEAQLRSPASLLNWTRRMIAIRRNHKVFGRGALRFLYPSNRKVLAYIREDAEETILCVVNVSRSPQAVELDLSEHKGYTPTEMTGGTAFPSIGDLPYLLTLPAFGFYWFHLTSAPADKPSVPAPTAAPELFTLVLTGGPETIFKGRERTAFERTVIPSFIASQRWYAARGMSISGAKLTDFAVVKSRSAKDDFLIPLVTLEMRNGEKQVYCAPLALVEGREDENLLPYAIARIRRGARVGLLYGAGSSPEFAISVVDALRRGEEIVTDEGGRMRFTATAALADYADVDSSEVKRISGEQSNTSIAVGDHMILKLYRRLQPGQHPEVEVGLFLTEFAGFRNTPALLGHVEHITTNGTSTAVAILQRYVRNQGDAWSWSTETLKRELDMVAFVSEQDRISLEDALADYLPIVRMLGQRTAELHLAFATPTDDEAFKAETFGAKDVATVIDDAKAQGTRAYAAMERLSRTSGTQDGPLQKLLARRAECWSLIERLAETPAGAIKTRVHGDYHLGQVLIVQNDVLIVDFEGEPSRPVDERRGKSSPLRDVAGMLRSFAYATETAARDVGQRFMPEDTTRVEETAEAARKLIETAFLMAYEEVARGTPVWVEDESTRQGLLQLHVLAKALYEINYEADHRPEWIDTPVRGVHAILDKAGANG
jgi:maltose alpha-D-glucosyltransferase/alpha-amylase